MNEDKSTLDTPRDTFALKSAESVNEFLVPALSSDLAEVTAAWPCLPPEIKAAILTLARSARGVLSVNTPSDEKEGVSHIDTPGEKGIRVNCPPLGKKVFRNSEPLSKKGASIQGVLYNGRVRREVKK